MKIMKKTPWLLIITTIPVLLLMFGCTKDYTCDIYSYQQDPYTGYWLYVYYTSDTYSGTSAEDAEEACEDDWGSYHDCRNCEEEE